jgi:hypothetical protein
MQASDREEDHGRGALSSLRNVHGDASLAEPSFPAEWHRDLPFAFAPLEQPTARPTVPHGRPRPVRGGAGLHRRGPESRATLAERRPGQSKRAGRFSRNAVMPSRASGVWLEAAMTSIA